jgi:hypothetical protein
MVDEDVITGNTTDKSVTLFVVKPLYCALFFHVFPLLVADPAIAGGSSVLSGAAPGIHPGNTDPFRVCCGIDERLWQTPDRIGKTISAGKE